MQIYRFKKWENLKRINSSEIIGKHFIIKLWKTKDKAKKLKARECNTLHKREQKCSLRIFLHKEEAINRLGRQPREVCQVARWSSRCSHTDFETCGRSLMGESGMSRFILPWIWAHGLLIASEVSIRARKPVSIRCLEKLPSPPADSRLPGWGSTA